MGKTRTLAAARTFGKAERKKAPPLPNGRGRANFVEPRADSPSFSGDTTEIGDDTAQAAELTCFQAVAEAASIPQGGAGSKPRWRVAHEGYR
jgi:hypothetical protein